VEEAEAEDLLLDDDDIAEDAELDTEPEEVEEPEPEEAVSAAQAAVDDDVQDAEAPVDDGSGPMTTGNAPT